MLKYLALLALGVAIGYGYGWRDALVHDRHVADRLVDRFSAGMAPPESSSPDETLRRLEAR